MKALAPLARVLVGGSVALAVNDLSHHLGASFFLGMASWAALFSLAIVIEDSE